MKELVNIVGAGPAGLVSAIVLRLNGYPVKVFEQHEEVGTRFNGDFQGLENWSAKEDVLDEFAHIGIDLDFEYEPYTEGTVFTPGQDSYHMQTTRPMFYLVKRGPIQGSLEMALKEQAISLGAEIVFNTRVDNLKGKAIIAIGPQKGDIIAVGYTFDTNSPKQAAVVFDDDLAPKGYAYLLINGGRGTLASVLFRKFRKAEYYRNECLRSFKERLGIDIRNKKKFAGYGNFFLRGSQIHNGKLYVGEAAGFQDLLWGFGMRYAVQSGYLAARSVIENLDYDILWKDELKSRLDTSLVNRYMFEKLGRPGYGYITKKLARGDSSEILHKQYNPSLLKSILYGAASRGYESKVVDLACESEACDCIRCRCSGHNAKESEKTGLSGPGKEAEDIIKSEGN